jgi:hypothetical protein
MARRNFEPTIGPDGTVVYDLGGRFSELIVVDWPADCVMGTSPSGGVELRIPSTAMPGGRRWCVWANDGGITVVAKPPDGILSSMSAGMLQVAVPQDYGLIMWSKH